MSRYIMYNVEYSKKHHEYNLWKTLYVNDTPLAFRSLHSGNKKECMLYAKLNKIKLDKELPI